MNYRFMRILVMFDLPMETSAEKRVYREFRKTLIKNGFLMLQKSVYCKLSINLTKVNSVINKIKANQPPNGIVQILVITEKQFASMEILVGKINPSITEGDQGIIII